MDDRAVNDDDPGREERQRGLGLGRGAGLLVVGLLAGLAVGWLAWHGGDGRGSQPSGSERMNTVEPDERKMVEGVDVTLDPVLGPEDAPVTIVEFSDFECPFCARFANNTAPALRRHYGDKIRWIFVNNPLQSIHPRAYDAGLASECAAEQDAFWDFYDAAFSGRYGLSNADLMEIGRDIGVDMEQYRSCYESAEYAEEMAEDIKEGQKFYILGTPTFFINGRRMEGAQPPEAFATVIDSILQAES